MKVRRSVFKQSKTARAMIIPAFWIESWRERGHEFEEVYVEVLKDDALLLTPVLDKPKKKKRG